MVKESYSDSPMFKHGKFSLIPDQKQSVKIISDMQLTTKTILAQITLNNEQTAAKMAEKKALQSQIDGLKK